MYRLRRTTRHRRVAKWLQSGRCLGERPKLVPYAGQFDGFHAVPASVSKTCLVRFDNNPVLRSRQRRRPAGRGSRPMPIASSSAEDGQRIVAEHPAFLRPRPDDLRSLALRCQCLHASPAPTAQWCPVQDWVLPAAMERVRRQARRRCRRRSTDGRRPHGGAYRWALPAVEAACAEAISHGEVHSADVILNILARQRDPGPPIAVPYARCPDATP